MRTQVERSYYIPLYNNSIKLLDNCATINNLDAMEYCILLGNDSMIIARIIDNKLNELYLKYSNTKCMKLVSVRVDGICNTYEYFQDKTIKRDDGAIYKLDLSNDEVKLYRESDNRVYTQGFIDIEELPNILYVIAHYLNKEYSCFMDIKNTDKVSNNNIIKINKLIEDVNSNKNNKIVKELKSKQKIMYWC